MLILSPLQPWCVQSKAEEGGQETPDTLLVRHAETGTRLAA